ncbi:hypothetical protein P5673_003172 [Acropora cervicornis]|uniref:Uncharacterized protein n=1 Tax=Acropora cervicornis TaxID=6130 RepID=A0AAD9VEM8_ACRCE|nr:hypothetical protein P5673_003172 [Acropora cervicornis]
MPKVKGFSSLRRVFTVFITSSFGSLLPDCTLSNEVDLPGFLGWWNSFYLLSSHDIGGVFLSQVASVYRGLESLSHEERQSHKKLEIESNGKCSKHVNND